MSATKYPAVRPEPKVALPLRIATGYLWRLVFICFAVYLFFLSLGYFSAIVVPMLVAVLLTAALHPLVNWLDRYMPRGLAVAITVLGGLGVLGGMIALIGTQIAGEMGQLYSQALQGIQQVQTWLAEGPLGLGSTQIDDYLQQATDALSANATALAQQALTATATAGEIITGLALAIFALIFLLKDGRKIWLWIVRFIPRAGRERTDLAGRAGWRSLTAFVRATVVVAAVDGIGIGLGAFLLGVPLALPLGVLVFLSAFVPIIGAIVSGAVAVLVALLALGFVPALIMLGIVIGVQQVESHVLQPFVMGRMVSIHPLAVVLAIGAGLIVAGIVGALFAVPLVALLNTFINALNDPGDVADKLEAETSDDSPDDKDKDKDQQLKEDAEALEAKESAGSGDGSSQVGSDGEQPYDQASAGRGSGTDRTPSQE